MNYAASRVIVFQENYQPRKKLDPYSLTRTTDSQTRTRITEAMFKEGIETKVTEVILSI